ncbi:MAG TPA: hypothetical protein VK184_23455 [Nostocaceae cyanobacterium]|nr:hypothetical protein [Nostocaceae cyanobacterium]
MVLAPNRQIWGLVTSWFEILVRSPSIIVTILNNIYPTGGVLNHGEDTS